MANIGRYEIIEELGRGAMGAVYKARDPQIGRTVAIKVIITTNLSKPDLEHFKQRFYREAQTAGQMSHPGIVTIYDIAEEESGQPYLVMEFVPGTTLDTLLSSAAEAERYGLKPGAEAFPVDVTLDVGIQIAQALDYAHRQGVVHRDIKPANILVAREESETGDSGGRPRLRVKIADFGIAKIAGTNLTQTGLMMGTPAFMSPEQVSMGPVDSRSDLFSLGGILYWMFTGQKPFPGESLTQITFKVVFGAPLPVAYVNPKLGPELDVVISRCLAKNSADRYATGRELAADLELVRSGKPLKTTLAPVSDITVMQSNPLPVVAAGLPPGQRPPQTPLPFFADSTVRVGSQQPVAPPTQAASSAAPVAAVAPPREEPAAKAHVASPVKSASISAPAPTEKTNKRMMGVAAAAVVLVLAGYYWTHRTGTLSVTPPPTQAVGQSAPAQSQVNVPPPPAETTDAATVSKADAAKKAESKPAAVGAKSSLQIDCRNNFDDAILTVVVDGKLLASESLTNKKPVSVTKPVLPGQHTVLVRVKSDKPKFDQQQEISADFAADKTRILVIDFGKGSGLGFRERKLGVKWGS